MLQATQVSYDQPSENSRLLSPRYLLDAARRRLFYFLVPFLLIAGLGVTTVFWLPAIYYSEARILIEGQQIPTDLVRPTVTTMPTQRIQLIEQRLMTRDNIMALVEKFRLFPEERSTLAPSEIVDLFRRKTQIRTTQLGAARAQADRITIVFTVGFEHENPDIAVRVANELVTLIMNEDVRNRTNQAIETTRFLSREATRLQSELAGVENQIIEVRRARAETVASAAASQAVLEQTNSQLANLKAELSAKTAQFSSNHPEVRALTRKIASLQEIVARTSRAIEVEGGLETLERQRTGLQANIDDVSRRLTAARLGEALERGQQSEKLEVLEQPTRPQQPIRPQRIKLAGLAIGLAFAAGFALAFGTEFIDSTIRTRADLTRLVESHMVVALPTVVTARDRMLRKVRLVVLAALMAAVLAAGATVIYLYQAELILAVEKFMLKLPRYLSR